MIFGVNTMNRAERRRQQRAGIKVQKEPTLNLKISDFDHMVSTAQKAAKERATAAALHEIDRQILERDEAFPLTLTLWFCGHFMCVADLENSVSSDSIGI